MDFVILDPLRGRVPTHSATCQTEAQYRLDVVKKSSDRKTLSNWDAGVQDLILTTAKPAIHYIEQRVNSRNE